MRSCEDQSCKSHFYYNFNFFSTVLLRIYFIVIFNYCLLTSCKIWESSLKDFFSVFIFTTNCENFAIWSVHYFSYELIPLNYDVSIPINVCTLSPITSISKLPVPSANNKFIINVGVGSTILRHLRHWYRDYYFIVPFLHIGHAIYYFLSLISAMETKIYEYTAQSFSRAIVFI